jgi:hypothetical protein
MVKLASRFPLRAHCYYCSHALEFRFVGCTTTGHYHDPASGQVRRIRPDHLVFLRDEAEAAELGLVPAAGGRQAGSEPAAAT